MSQPSASTTTAVPLIPRSVLFGNPERALPTVSPDGAMLAYLAPHNGVLNVWVKPLGSDEPARRVTDDRERGVRIYFWSGDSQHVLYLQDAGGDENWRLYRTGIAEGATTTDLTPFENVQVDVIERNKRFPDELLIAMNKEDASLKDAYHLDLRTDKLTLVAKNPGSVIGWVADADLAVRAAQASREDGGFELLVRDTPEAQWRMLVQWSLEDAMSRVSHFSADGRFLFALDSRNANAGRLVKLDVATGEVGEVLASDPIYDATDLLVNPDSHEVEAVLFARARMEWEVLDEQLKPDFAAIAALDDGDFIISGRDDAENVWIVGYTKDAGAIAYYAFERESKQGTFLFHHQPQLAEYTLARMEPVSYESRDGLTIHGYLTFPPGTERKNLPMVLLVHGGPWARDHWGYDPQAQWLANRGYLCFQVNFRGSTGFGKEFVNAGDREWAAKMHDDLVDAVEWAVARGYADKARVAIFGGSYGGYAALVGATFTPDLFRCAVDIVGPSNLITLIRSIPPYWAPLLATLKKRVGDPDTEEEFLKSRSPLFKVDNIKIPILIAQGANDPRVKQAESEQIVAVMKEKGLAYEYMLYEDEGHGFAKPDNRLSFYAAAERFLAKHLGGGRYEE